MEQSGQTQKLQHLEEVFEQYGQCLVSITLGVIGGKWKPAILYLIEMGVGRFGELHRRLPGISKRMLTAHLRELEADGILHREVFAEVPPKVIYTLTETGKTLEPILSAMADWGRNYEADTLKMI